MSLDPFYLLQALAPKLYRGEPPGCARQPFFQSRLIVGINHAEDHGHAVARGVKKRPRPDAVNVDPPPRPSRYELWSPGDMVLWSGRNIRNGSTHSVCATTIPADPASITTDVAFRMDNEALVGVLSGVPHFAPLSGPRIDSTGFILPRRHCEGCYLAPGIIYTLTMIHARRRRAMRSSIPSSPWLWPR